MEIQDAALVQPIAAGHPCGESLEDTQLLASFDAYGLFGRSVPLSAETDWREIRDNAREALRKSKDFRLLTHLACSVLRTEGFAAFSETLLVAARWLELWGEEVFPLIDEDAILRRNALNGFADRMATVDGVRRAAILKHPQFGPVSMRDIEIATGQLALPEGETATFTADQIESLFAATSVEDLRTLQDQLEAAVTSLKAIEAAMSSRSGSQATPDFAALSDPLARTLKRVNDLLATRPADAGSAEGAADASSGSAGDQAPNGAGVANLGAVRTRQDATRAMDAVAQFFRTHEPSSPIPLLLERAKRLVAKNFLEVLAELAPEALAPAKAASGVRDTDSSE